MSSAAIAHGDVTTSFTVHEDKQMVGDPQDSTTQPPVPNEEHQQQQQQEQQQKHDDGMPGQQPLHIERK